MAPMREYMITQEAQELVRSGKVKDLDTAKELVRYRQGVPQTQTAESGEPPRNANGQFTSRQNDQVNPVVQARVNMLIHQADKIRASGGPDVIAAYKSDPEIHDKIVSGEMDFHDVAELLKSQQGGKKPPSPMRSPNGASGNQKTPIEKMTDAQFDRLVKKIQGGARYSLK